MNEQLFYTIGQQRYTDDVTRGERNYARQIPTRSTRDRIALRLVNLATRLQPEIVARSQQPVQPSPA